MNVQKYIPFPFNTLKIHKIKGKQRIDLEINFSVE